MLDFIGTAVLLATIVFLVSVLVRALDAPAPAKLVLAAVAAL